MTKKYSATELQLRADIFATHSLLINFLTFDVMNNLIHLFDEDCCNGLHFTHKTIKGFIEEERKERGLDNTTITISSKADKKLKASSRFVLDISKNGKGFIHLTIHLVSKERNPEKDGMLHIKKDIYTVKRSCRNKDEYCTLLKVEKPNDRSLHFSIGFNDDTSSSPLASSYDEEVNQEMYVIIAVLNKMFDADNDNYFVGNNDMRIFLPIENKTNIILSNMNNHPQIAIRKDWGKLTNINKSQHPNNAYMSSTSTNSKRKRNKPHKNKYSHTRKSVHK